MHNPKLHTFVVTSNTTLQHTATHCNTLQHTATHCSTCTTHTHTHTHTYTHLHIIILQCVYHTYTHTYTHIHTPAHCICGGRNSHHTHQCSTPKVFLSHAGRSKNQNGSQASPLPQPDLHPQPISPAAAPALPRNR